MKNALQKQIQVKLRPKENIEYTSLFIKKDKGTGKIVKRMYTLIYLGTNQDKRDMFYNKTTKNIVFYSYGYFAFLKKKRFVSAVPIESDENETANKNVQQTISIFNPYKQERAPIKSEQELNGEKILNVLRAASVYDSARIEKEVGETPQAILYNVERLKNLPRDALSNEYRQILRSMMIKAYEIITREKVPEFKIKINTEVKNSVQEESSEDRIIRTLREATFAEELSVFARVGRVPRDIADDLENIKAKEENFYTTEYVNRVFGEMQSAIKVIKNYTI